VTFLKEESAVVQSTAFNPVHFQISFGYKIVSSALNSEENSVISFE
jgi:hypothetical protein